jgi:hypothetical protein
MITLILKLIFGSMQPGEVTHRRIFNRFDPARNVTILVAAGPLDAHRLAGAMEVLRGKAHARHYAQKRTPLFEGKEAAA